VVRNRQQRSEPVQLFELTDGLWERLEPLLPKQRAVGKRGGRPPIPLRSVANAIFFVLRTGCQWKALKKSYYGCSASSAHRYLQKWVRKKVFEKFWQAGLQDYDELQGIKWKWQAADGAMSKAPLGGALLVRTRLTGRRTARSARSSRTRREFQSDSR
jgi:putative transposase